MSVPSESRLSWVVGASVVGRFALADTRKGSFLSDARMILKVTLLSTAAADLRPGRAGAGAASACQLLATSKTDRPGERGSNQDQQMERNSHTPLLLLALTSSARATRAQRGAENE